jgi:hypothetical protein
VQPAPKKGPAMSITVARACSPQWLTLTANQRSLLAPIWSKCFLAAGPVKMQTRTRSFFLLCCDRSCSDSALGCYSCPAPQDAGQLQLVFRKQHSCSRERNDQMDMPSLPRHWRALHGQRMHCMYHITNALVIMTYIPSSGYDALRSHFAR